MCVCLKTDLMPAFSLGYLRVCVRACVRALFLFQQENRRVVHELAVAYGLVTQSFDLEPKRYVSAIKQKVQMMCCRRDYRRPARCVRPKERDIAVQRPTGAVNENGTLQPK